MNILSLVFSILLILSFGFYACIEKGKATRELQKSFTSSALLRRALFRTYEGAIYTNLPGFRPPSSKDSSKTPAKEKKSAPKKNKKPQKISSECAKINLFPLIEGGKEQQPVLYQTIVHFLRLFYEKPLFGFFSKKEKFAEEFLGAWIKNLQAVVLENPKASVNLEQLVFHDPEMQILYYNMLRGAKGKYPSLLDFVKAQPRKEKEEKLCLVHASPSLLSIFVGAAADELYQVIHTQDVRVLPIETIEELCREHHHPLVKEMLPQLNLILALHNRERELILLEEEEGGSLSFRKKTYRRQGS